MTPGERDGTRALSEHDDSTMCQSRPSAQSETERLLREQKLQLDAALNNMSHALCMLDANGKIVLFNRHYTDMVGLPASDLVGKSLLDLFRLRKATGKFSGDPEAVFAAVQANMRAGLATKTIMEAQDGRALRVIDQPMPDGGWVATFEDITEQRTL